MALQGCIGAVPNLRTRAAIMRFWVLDGRLNFWRLNDAWFIKRDGGCPSCGAVRKYSTGFCRRCGRILRKVRDNGDPLGIVPSMCAAKEKQILDGLNKAQKNAYLQAKKLRDEALRLGL